jgi:HAD superfamily hydrolase (TIGR01509 family)
MSGGLFTNQLLCETGLEISVEIVERLRQRHAEAYTHYAEEVRPLPGARELLAWLSDCGIRFAIATSGRMATASLNLAALGLDLDRVPVVTRDQVKYAKPDPDLFLAAAGRLGAPIESALVVGDSIWQMLAATRCRALGVGLMSGGYGLDELQQSARSAFTRIRPTFCFTSTSLGCGANSRLFRPPGRLRGCQFSSRLKARVRHAKPRLFWRRICSPRLVASQHRS